MSDKTDDVLEMSDEEFMNMDTSAFEQKPADDPAGADDADADGTGGDKDDDDETGSDDKVTTDTGTDPADSAADPTGKPAVVAAGKDAIADDKAPAVDDKSKPAVTDEISDTQYMDIGKQIMGEFKANGTTIKIKNVEDAIQLMQMGANYHKKMSGLKPSLKTLKLLENNDLLDPEKLNYLIDLSQKKPEAIAQLLKDSKIDPMNIDLTAGKEYVPQHRSVSDTEILLDEVLDSISHSPVYNRTLTVLGDEWDSDSRNLLAKTPEVIRTINTHIENGIYDQVAKAVEYERSLGKLAGVNDYEAYQRIGAYMHENNLFVGATVKPGASTRQTAPVDTTAQDAATAAEEKARADRKKAASPSRGGKVADEKVDYNPLTMSDEEFIKLNKLSI